MATKRARVNKTLEKAKKLISKKGKKKTTKRAYPEGQNAPQSKAYDMENDKVVPAKRTGYRFTKEGAKKLGKQPNDRPTAEEIEKYRNETFKVKGKINKSGPKGVGDGSFRYLYIESRADKSDLNKARKLELGGYNPDEMLKLNIYVDVYEDDYDRGEGNMVNSYKVDWLKDPQVKASDLIKYISEELYLSENPNNYSIDDDGKIHTAQLQDEDGIHVNNDEQTYKRWKKGEEKLYIAHYFINVTAVKNRKPSVEELAQATGIGTYAKGGGVEDLRKRFEGYTDEELQIFNGDNKETLKYWNRKDAIEDAIKSSLDEQNSQGFMAKGGVVFDPKEVRRFEKYVFSWYGKNGVAVDDMEEDIPATTAEVLKAVSQYLAFCTKTKKWGGGDSFDRQVVHDIIAYNRNPKTTALFYEDLIKDMKKTPILEYGGILQPMIGGVNADPRFDIYNTTMFAEKGAEVPKKKPKFEEGIKSAVKDYFHSKEIDDPTFWKDRDGEYNIEEMVEMAKDKFNSSEDILERYAQEYADSKYAKGGKIKVRYVEENEVHDWTLEDVLDVINRDRSEDWTDYDKSDWQEGWDSWVEGEFYSLKDENGKPLNKFEDGGEMAKGGEITMADLKKREIKKINQLIEEYAHKGESIEFYEPFSINVNDTDYLAWAVMEDAIAVTDNEGYDGGMPLKKLTFFQLQKVTSKIMDNIGEMAKGGIVKDIEAKKKALIKKAKARGIYENFGQKEVQELQDKYGHYSKEIAEFDNWAMNFDNDDLKKYKHGGSTHEQGYDDREDERLAMRHGKIASKDFVGSHKRREHSRRDDARFETRNK